MDCDRKDRKRLLKPNSCGSCKLYKGVKLLKLSFLSVVVKSKENMAVLKIQKKSIFYILIIWFTA